MSSLVQLNSEQQVNEFLEEVKEVMLNALNEKRKIEVGKHSTVPPYQSDNSVNTYQINVWEKVIKLSD